MTSQQYWQGQMLKIVPLKVCTMLALLIRVASGTIWQNSNHVKLVLTQPLLQNLQQRGPTFAHILIKPLRVVKQFTFNRLTKH